MLGRAWIPEYSVSRDTRDDPGMSHARETMESRILPVTRDHPGVSHAMDPRILSIPGYQ